jgi:hypothetical protein
MLRCSQLEFAWLKEQIATTAIIPRLQYCLVDPNALRIGRTIALFKGSNFIDKRVLYYRKRQHNCQQITEVCG